MFNSSFATSSSCFAQLRLQLLCTGGAQAEGGYMFGDSFGLPAALPEFYTRLLMSLDATAPLLGPQVIFFVCTPLVC